MFGLERLEAGSLVVGLDEGVGGGELPSRVRFLEASLEAAFSFTGGVEELEDGGLVF